ncbi:unnamed protein product [Dicrocoelium dendriticum]|nr:unnamed protein product [Dicrocoelium dendriticum]
MTRIQRAEHYPLCCLKTDNKRCSRERDVSEQKIKIRSGWGGGCLMRGGEGDRQLGGLGGEGTESPLKEYKYPSPPRVWPPTPNTHRQWWGATTLFKFLFLFWGCCIHLQLSWERFTFSRFAYDL